MFQARWHRRGRNWSGCRMRFLELRTAMPITYAMSGALIISNSKWPPSAT
jgi:hypothetical protein